MKPVRLCCNSVSRGNIQRCGLREMESAKLVKSYSGMIVDWTACRGAIFLDGGSFNLDQQTSQKQERNQMLIAQGVVRKCLVAIDCTLWCPPDPSVNKAVWIVIRHVLCGNINPFRQALLTSMTLVGIALPSPSLQAYVSRMLS